MSSDTGTNTELSSELTNAALTTLNQTGDCSHDDYLDQFTVNGQNNGKEGYYDGYDDQLMASPQIPQNQQIYCDLDNALFNLTRDLNIEKLIAQTRGDSELILWY